MAALCGVPSAAFLSYSSVSDVLGRAIPRPKGGAGKLARKITGAVVTVAAAALAITLVAKVRQCSNGLSRRRERILLSGRARSVSKIRLRARMFSDAPPVARLLVPDMNPGRLRVG